MHWPLIPEAIAGLADRYRKAGTRLRPHHLASDCLALLTKAQDMAEMDVVNAPHFHVADQSRLAG